MFKEEINIELASCRDYYPPSKGRHIAAPFWSVGQLRVLLTTTAVAVGKIRRSSTVCQSSPSSARVKVEAFSSRCPLPLSPLPLPLPLPLSPLPLLVQSGRSFSTIADFGTFSEEERRRSCKERSSCSPTTTTSGTEIASTLSSRLPRSGPRLKSLHVDGTSRRGSKQMCLWMPPTKLCRECSNVANCWNTLRAKKSAQASSAVPWESTST
mmetsp:Transcript_77858/g.161751  ORF Transcript_77858/g.161751 Transcript_77858/m.161751 type:complete len:211 (+) Transcript_77858:271-903(+)